MFISQAKTLTLKFCPLCAQPLETTLINGRDRLVCFACEFVHWDNPAPVTATIIPYISAASGSIPSPQHASTHSPSQRLNAAAGSLSSHADDTGLVLVRRKVPPFVNDWCLPGGFVEAHEAPEISATREVEEETGLNVDIERIIGAYSPGKGINVIIIFYLAKKASGTLTPGDDASEVGIFKQNNLPENIAFPLHKQMIDKWFAGSL